VNSKPAPDFNTPLQELAAALLHHPVWMAAPAETDAHFFLTWQGVSMGLQTALRHWIPELAYRDIARFEDRDLARTMIVYEACRPSFGRPRTEFTYDVADAITVEAALRMTGHATQRVLARIEKRLDEADRRDLARRYSPVWNQDMIAAVRRRPRGFLALIGKEARVIDAVIHLGAARTPAASGGIAKSINSALRSVFSTVMRELGPLVLEEATRLLGEEAARRAKHVGGSGPLEHGHPLAARRPNPRIGVHEDRDHRRPDRGGEVRDPTVVSDVNAGGRDPAGEVVQIFDTRRVFECLLRQNLGGTRAPAHRYSDFAGDGTEILDGPTLGGAARERMDDREFFERRGRN
jgi:hypothetical protein